jgi:diacylglycerol kinase (ATP)
MQRRYVAFVNPSTRGNAKRLMASLRDAAPRDVVVEARETTADPIDPNSIPSGGEIEAVIAVGGDGTVAEVATAIGDRDVPLAIIPGGSTNIIARYLGIPKSPVKAAALIFGDHAIKPIDVGICGEKRFLHMAGAGFDSRLFLATNRSLKRRLGWLAYLTGAARSVALPPARFTIDVDGNVIQLVSPLVLIANGAAIIHPQLSIYPHIDNDDGLLDVVIFTATNTQGVVRSILRFATRSLPRSAHVIRLQGKNISLVADPPMPVQLDGDVVGETPSRFSIADRQIKILVPVKK